MAIEVANLLARISYTVDGAGQAAAAARQVADSLDATGQAARGATDSIRFAADHLDDLRRKAGEASADLQIVNDHLARSGVTYDQAAASVRQYGEQAEAAQRELTSLREEQQRLNEELQAAQRISTLPSIERAEGETSRDFQQRFAAERDALKATKNEAVAAAEAKVAAIEKEIASRRALIDEILREQAASQGLVDAYEAVPELTSKSVAAGRAVQSGTDALTRTVDKVKGSVEGANGAIAGTGRAAARSQGGMRGFLGSLLNINRGSVLSVHGLASVIGQMTKLGLVVTLAFQVLQKFIRSYEQLAATSTLPDLSAPFVNLASDIGIAEGEMKKLISRADNLTASFGVTGLTDDMAELAEQVRGAFSGTDAERFSQAMQSIQGAVVSGNLGGLRELGLPVTQIEQQIEAIRRANGYMSEQEEIMLRFQLVQEAINAKAGEFAEMNERGLTSIAEASASVKDAFAPLIETIAPAFSFLLTQVKEFAKQLKPLVKLWATLSPIMIQLRIVFYTVGAVLMALGKFLEIFNEALADAIEYLEDFLRSIEKIPLIGAFATALLGVGETARQISDDLKGAADDTETLGRSFEDAKKAAEALQDKITGGAGLLDAMTSYGDALAAFDKKPTGANAIDYFKSYERLISAALSDSGEFLLVLDEMSRVASITDDPKQAKALQGVIDAARAVWESTEPIVDGLITAQGSATDAANTTADAMGGLAGKADVLTTAVQGSEAALTSWAKTYTADMVLNVSGPGAALMGIGGGGGGGGSGVSTGGSWLAGLANMVAGAVGANPMVQAGLGGAGALTGVTVGTPQQGNVNMANRWTAQARASYTDDSSDRAEAARFGRIGTQGAVQKQADLLGDLNDAISGFISSLGDRGGGGGGGGSGMDFDAVRKFMQEVNRAIAIASNQGVRVGTAGNAIPFEPGSFVSAEGGNLSVDTILIRGVWDFADPAAKRQIVRELQDALKALQAEI